MQKIPRLFKLNYDGQRLAYDEVAPGAEWVLAGEGVATRKFVGTCCLIAGRNLFKRYSCRDGKKLPKDFQLAERAEQKDNRGHDVVKLYGWVPIGDGPQDRYHREALAHAVEVGGRIPADGPYELIGPNVQGNPEHCDRHVLVKHGVEYLPGAPRTFDDLRRWFEGQDIEGIVWHHPDGRMIKIKKKDFGLSRRI